MGTQKRGRRRTVREAVFFALFWPGFVADRSGPARSCPSALGRRVAACSVGWSQG